MVVKKIIALVILILFPFQSFAFSLGLVSDIHADSYKKRNIGKYNVTYPKRANSYFKKALTEMKNKGVELVIITGDITNRGQKKYYLKLKKTASNSKMKIIWIRGNHDSKHFNQLNAERFYFFDFKDSWRVICLDSSVALGNSTGQLDASQINFLKEKSDTERNIIIAMHHPPISKTDFKPLKNYADFWKAVNEKENIRLIATGHWHSSFNEKINGKDVTITDALTNQKKLNYAIKKLDN